MTFEEIEQFALQDENNAKIYETEYTINGYRVYSVFKKRRQERVIEDLPAFILAKDNDVHYAYGDELKQILKMTARL